MEVTTQGSGIGQTGLWDAELLFWTTARADDQNA